MRRIACPSKSGIERAIEGIPATSPASTGMIPSADIGTLPLSGHKLQKLVGSPQAIDFDAHLAMLASQGLNVRSNLLVP
jgi:hypothetical protein